jgi:hypothetical protein
MLQWHAGCLKASVPCLLHAQLAFTEQPLEPLPSIEQQAPLLVKEQQQRGAVVVNVSGQHLQARCMHAWTGFYISVGHTHVPCHTLDCPQTVVIRTHSYLQVAEVVLDHGPSIISIGVLPCWLMSSLLLLMLCLIATSWSLVFAFAHCSPDRLEQPGATFSGRLAAQQAPSSALVKLRQYCSGGLPKLLSKPFPVWHKDHLSVVLLREEIRVLTLSQPLSAGSRAEKDEVLPHSQLLKEEEPQGVHGLCAAHGELLGWRQLDGLANARELQQQQQTEKQASCRIQIWGPSFIHYALVGPTGCRLTSQRHPASAVSL